jgi:hypothetical protein
MNKRGLIILLFLTLVVLPLITAENTEQLSTVTSILLTSEGNNIEWKTEGNSPKGFKVVWSQNENPTYPLRSGDKYHYYSESEKESDTINEAFSGEGTYYVRVCEYLGGECGIYSNQVEVTIDNSLPKLPINDEPETNQNPVDQTQIPTCNGCSVNGTCFSLGYRMNGNFCSNNLTFIPQTEKNEACENSFECKGNICASGQCISESLIKKVLKWLTSFFS